MNTAFSKIIYWIFVILIICFFTNEVVYIHKKYHPNEVIIQYGQKWVHYNENPFENTKQDTLIILDTKKDYVLFKIRCENHGWDTLSEKKHWFQSYHNLSFYSKIE